MTDQPAAMKSRGAAWIWDKSSKDESMAKWRLNSWVYHFRIMYHSIHIIYYIYIFLYTVIQYLEIYRERERQVALICGISGYLVPGSLRYSPLLFFDISIHTSWQCEALSWEALHLHLARHRSDEAMVAESRVVVFKWSLFINWGFIQIDVHSQKDSKSVHYQHGVFW